MHNFKVNDLIHNKPKHKRKKKSKPIKIKEFYQYAYGPKAKIDEMVKLEKVDGTISYMSILGLDRYYKW